MDETIERVATALMQVLKAELDGHPIPGDVAQDSWSASGGSINMETLARVALEAAKPDLTNWRYPQWVEDEPGSGFWKFVQHGATGWSGELVGEAYPIERESGDGFKWHCKTSDWRDTNAKTIEQAKAECEASFWKEAWHEATGHHRSPAKL